MKRIAANIIIIDNVEYHNHVVELTDDNQLIRHYPLEKELPFTIWTQDCINIDTMKSDK